MKNNHADLEVLTDNEVTTKNIQYGLGTIKRTEADFHEQEKSKKLKFSLTNQPTILLSIRDIF